MDALVAGGLLYVLFAIVLAIVWLVLPFAVIGIKPLLRELISETRKTNAALERSLAVAWEQGFQAAREGQKSPAATAMR
jgi:hypothetical protein